MVTTILLARHGETEWNREGRWQGWADPSLNDTGRAQARELAEQLRATPFDAVYSSDLRRALETAVILAAPHDLAVVTDADLREIDVGAWSGLTRAEITERFPDGDRPGGETREPAQRARPCGRRAHRARPPRRARARRRPRRLPARALQRHLDDDVEPADPELQRLRAPLPRRRLPTRLR